MTEVETTQKITEDPTYGRVTEVYANGKLCGRNVNHAGTGFHEKITDGHLVIRNTYKNYQLSTEEAWDIHGNLIKSEWHLTRSDIAQPLYFFGIAALLVYVLWKLAKRRIYSSRRA